MHNPKKFHNIRVKYDYERDCFNKKEMYKALEELKCIGLNYFYKLKNKKQPNLKLHYLCLCQGAALYYAHLIDPKTNPEYCGVKDFDVWLFVSGYKFVSGYNKNYSSRKPKNEKIIAQCKPKRVDLLIYNSKEFDSENLKNNDGLIKVLQNDRNDSKRETAICLLDKAIIELLPDKKILYVNKEYSDEHKKC